jgi:hypothetical protein
MTSDAIYTWGTPEHEAFASKIRNDPSGLGAQLAQLDRVSYACPNYRYVADDGKVYEFYWRFHTECGKDKCLSADREMPLMKLVNKYDAQEKDYF